MGESPPPSKARALRSSLPPARGPLTEALFHGWRSGDWSEPGLDEVDALVDDDLHLALWCAYQLHYGGFHGVDDALEWDSGSLTFRSRLERSFEGALRDEHRPEQLPDDPVTAMRVIAEWSAPPLAKTLATTGDLTQLREFAVHRSAYQLKEADGHTWALPRLWGPTKAAVVEIQADEYGGGKPGASHAELFASAMEELGLDPTFGHYVAQLPGTTLATDNLVSMFGLHTRLRGALVGHLAHFELCSPVPMARYNQAAKRHDLPQLAHFYAVHVEADVHHGRLALDRAVAPMAEAEPELAAELSFGASALHRVEARFARQLLDAWARDRTSLLPEPLIDLRDVAEPSVDAGVERS